MHNAVRQGVVAALSFNKATSNGKQINHHREGQTRPRDAHPHAHAHAHAVQGSWHFNGHVRVAFADKAYRLGVDCDLPIANPVRASTD